MELAEHISANQALAEAVCQRLGEEINKLGYAATDIAQYPHYGQASFVLIRDPYSGGENLSCHWHNTSNKRRLGSLQFNSDGSFYAEFAVDKAHPCKPQWFVEGVTAWGQKDNIKAEAKLIAIPQ